MHARELGIPSIIVCSSAFTTLARAQSKALGCPDLPLAVIPHPFGSRTRNEVRNIAVECMSEIARLLRNAAAEGGTRRDTMAGEGHASEVEVPGTQEEFDAYCRERGWSDGLPLVPPKRARVARMLDAASRG